MKILSARDSIFRISAGEHEQWFPEPKPGFYDDDHDWQKAHLWDHYTETDNTHGPYRGPSIIHHPDLQYALDHGWRVVGGAKSLDHQTRGETGSGTDYLYKIGQDGLIHSAHLNHGPENTFVDDQKYPYDTAPDNNWRHLVKGEGVETEGPKSHDTLMDLVDDEAFRSADPTHKGYSDFQPLAHYRGFNEDPSQENWKRQYHHTIRRAWETGTNDPGQHWDDPIPDPYADLDKIKKNQKPAPDYLTPSGEQGAKHPRYGSTDD